MKRLVIELEWHPLGGVTTGEWCNTCYLPSVLSWRLVLVYVATLHVAQRLTVHHCPDCRTTTEHQTS